MLRAPPTAAGQLHCIVIHATQYKPTRLQAARSERCHERQAVPISSGGLHRRPCAAQAFSPRVRSEPRRRSTDFRAAGPPRSKPQRPEPDRPKLLFSAGARRSSREPNARRRGSRRLRARSVRHENQRQQCGTNEGEWERSANVRAGTAFRMKASSPSTLLVWITACGSPAARREPTIHRPAANAKPQCMRRAQPPPAEADANPKPRAVRCSRLLGSVRV